MLDNYEGRINIFPKGVPMFKVGDKVVIKSMYKSIRFLREFSNQIHRIVAINDIGSPLSESFIKTNLFSNYYPDFIFEKTTDCVLLEYLNSIMKNNENTKT